MPTVPTPMNITVSSSTATLSGEKVKITNLSRSGVVYLEFGTDADGSISFNPANEDASTSWVVGDSLIAEMHGRMQGYGTGKITTKGVKITMTTAADTGSPGVDL